MDFGRLRIDVWYLGNHIQVFNSLKICLLVINGKVVDAFTELVAFTFQMHGQIQTPSGEKTILVKFGISAMMRVYCDGVQIAKRWLPLG